MKDHLVAFDHSFHFDDGNCSEVVLTAGLLMHHMHIPSLAPFCFSFLLQSVCIRLCLPWPYLVGVKRKKLRCVFAVRCWRLQQQLPEEAGVEGQYSYWWLLRKRKWEERFMRTEGQGVYNLSEAMKNAQASLRFRVTEKQDVNGCCSWHLIHRAYICCVCSVQECLMTTLTFILNGKCENKRIHGHTAI